MKIKEINLKELPPLCGVKTVGGSEGLFITKGKLGSLVILRDNFREETKVMVFDNTKFADLRCVGLNRNDIQEIYALNEDGSRGKLLWERVVEASPEELEQYFSAKLKLKESTIKDLLRNITVKQYYEALHPYEGKPIEENCTLTFINELRKSCDNLCIKYATNVGREKACKICWNQNLLGEIPPKLLDEVNQNEQNKQA